MGSFETYEYSPETFRTVPFAEGMEWQYIKRTIALHTSRLVLQTRHWTLFGLLGNKSRNLYHHLCAARAASGTPGGHGHPKHLFRNFLGLHNSANRQTIREASGRESRCASQGIHSHQCLRATRSMLRRQSKFQAQRSESRRQYRKWMQDSLSGKFALVHPGSLRKG